MGGTAGLDELASRARTLRPWASQTVCVVTFNAALGKGENGGAQLVVEGCVHVVVRGMGLDLTGSESLALCTP